MHRFAEIMTGLLIKKINKNYLQTLLSAVWWETDFLSTFVNCFLFVFLQLTFVNCIAGISDDDIFMLW